jgi:DNA polymerase-1
VWDLGAVHKVLYGGRRDDAAAVSAALQGLPEPPRPGRAGAQMDSLFDAPGDEHVPPLDRHQAQELQEEQLRALPDPRADPVGPPLPLVTAWAESSAALLCAELEQDGLPFDRSVATVLLREVLGDGSRAVRDAPVMALAREDEGLDLRSPGQVREALDRRGIVVPDTRSWRLEPYRQAHPFVDALLTWRKAERLATTYGEAWMDEHLGTDGRLRGEWSAADGGAGRMTASAGLHNLPAELRPAVAAEPGHVLVRADLGQVEPRVLAAVSGDRAFAAAAAADDLYTPVAQQLGCDRPRAKIAVLAAMYGQTSGTAGQALAQMERAYPSALSYLRAAEEAGRVGRDVRTHGGRLIRSGTGGAGRYVRNAVIQGAAAELFKAWAAAVRNGIGGGTPPGSIVLCLHDELLLHVPAMLADETVALLHEALMTVASHWAAGSGVRFVADVAVVRRWSEAK